VARLPSYSYRVNAGCIGERARSCFTRSTLLRCPMGVSTSLQRCVALLILFATSYDIQSPRALFAGLRLPFALIVASHVKDNIPEKKMSSFRKKKKKKPRSPKISGSQASRRLADLSDALKADAFHIATHAISHSLRRRPTHGTRCP